MIYPNARGVLLAAAGAPVALLVAVLAPALWWIGPAWTLLIGLLTLADGLRAPSAARVDLRVEVPPSAEVGTVVPLRIRARWAGRAPRRVEASWAVSPLLGASATRGSSTVIAGEAYVSTDLSALRRGTARVEGIWLRWTGPLGLAWRQLAATPDATVLVTPDIRPVHRVAERLFEIAGLPGLLARLGRDEGGEFEALTEYRQGFDRRAIDWKQSARHGKLIAREYRPERNNLLVFAIDAGRAMCEPVDGLPRVDRAVSAALVGAFVALKLGDPVALFGFDRRPRLATGAVTGGASFGALQRAAAGLDYSTHETNFTLGLTALDAQLRRRAMIVLFTEFTDAAAAELMLRGLGPLVDRHLLVCVTFVDEELEALASAEPGEVLDVARAVAAAELLRERRLVMGKLQRLGIHVLEARHDQLADRLVDRYLELKRRNLL